MASPGVEPTPFRIAVGISTYSATVVRYVENIHSYMYGNCSCYALPVASHLASFKGTSEIFTHIGDNCHRNLYKE